MDYRLTIRKEDEGNDLFDGYKEAKVEEKFSIEIINSSNIEKAIKEYEFFIKEVEFSLYKNKLKGLDYLLNKPTNVLTPSEIFSFTQIYDDFVTSDFKVITYFVKNLIKSSYDAGHNNFKLNTGVFPNTQSLFSSLEGNKKNPIKITINGNVGDHLFQNSSYINCTINGDCDHNLGIYSRNNEFIINGSVKSKAFRFSKNSTIILDNFEDIGGSQFLEYLWNSKIIVRDKEAIDQIVNTLRNQERLFTSLSYFNGLFYQGYNTLSLLDEKGEENIIKRFKRRR